MIVNKSFVRFFMLHLIFFSLCAPAFAVTSTIIYPPDNSYMTQPHVRVIGTASNDLDQVTLSLTNSKGTKELNCSVTNNAFSQLIDLTEGDNSLALSGQPKSTHKVIYTDTKSIPKNATPFITHSKNELTGNCALCHQPPSKGSINYSFVEQKLSCITDKCHNTFGVKKYQHGPFADRKCTECHNPHGTIYKNFTYKERAQLCFRCHQEAEHMATGGKYVHFPVTKGECLSCHEHHESNLAYHLKRDTILDLCLGCHTKTIIEHKVMHEPVNSGDCNACHSPHVSEYKGLLYQGGKDLCLTCHEVRKEEFASKYIHEPVAKDCSLCHDPHGSGTIYHLRTPKDDDGKYIIYEKPIAELCLGCHRKLDPEVAEQIEKSTVTHKPVREGKCTECHTPHSTNYAKQLKAPLKELCFKCHPALGKVINESRFKHGPVRTSDCAQCHLVHGSNHKKLLRANYSEKYQGSYDPKNFELCFSCHSAKITEDPRSLDTGFRDGTKNLHFVHVNRKKNGRFCITCHATHASDQEKHIRKEFTFKKKFKITLEYTKTATGGGCVVGCHKPRQYDREQPAN